MSIEAPGTRLAGFNFWEYYKTEIEAGKTAMEESLRRDMNTELYCELPEERCNLMPVINENDEGGSFRSAPSTEIVPKSTRPLPYVQIGMKLVNPSDSAPWWEVNDIFEDDGYERPGEPDGIIAARLISSDGRYLRTLCQILRRDWGLYEDFDARIER